MFTIYLEYSLGLLANNLQIIDMGIKAVEAQASLTLDTRRIKKNGKYPVKVFVWSSLENKGKHYSIGIDLTEQEYHSAWETVKPRKEHQSLRRKLSAVLEKVMRSIEDIEHFTFEQYEQKVSTPKGESQNIFWHYTQRIAYLKDREQISTAEISQLACKALKRFAGSDRLTFRTVTPKWLQAFEDDMVSRGRSLTTVGIYLRTLKTVFRDAVTNKDITDEFDPFGKRKYVIPESRNTKKALTAEQLRELRDAVPETTDQEKARDFFFFSFAGNGMNIRDIALLKFSDLEADKFSFVRQKTRNIKKDRQTPITVYLTPFHQRVIKKYANNPETSTYVFPIIKEGTTPEKQRNSVKNFTRFVNQHLKKICRKIGLPEVSTYWARHSFATISIQKGATMEFMRESLGHSNMKTTQNYFNGFDDEAKRDFASRIMDF